MRQVFRKAGLPFSANFPMSTVPEIIDPVFTKTSQNARIPLKVHKIENFFDSDFGICIISLLVMHK